MQPNVSPGSVLALGAHALQFVCNASCYLCIIVFVHYIRIRDILCASNIVRTTFHVHKIFCASKNEPYFVCITFIPKLTTSVYIFYLIPGTRPRISSSSLLFWFHLGKHLKTRIEEVVFQFIDWSQQKTSTFFQWSRDQYFLFLADAICNIIISRPSLRRRFLRSVSPGKSCTHERTW